MQRTSEVKIESKYKSVLLVFLNLIDLLKLKDAGIAKNIKKLSSEVGEDHLMPEENETEDSRAK